MWLLARSLYFERIFFLLLPVVFLFGSFGSLSMDRSSFLIWNVRGLNDKARRDNLRKVVDDARPAAVSLQETKLSHISERDVISFLGRDFTNFVYLPAQQTQGVIRSPGVMDHPSWSITTEFIATRYLFYLV
jgi:hypothetical protein